ncbi:MAG: hypothetical protein GHHEDOFH_02479 [Pseudorhodoplanes sp.]|nr:hypothetical protein [Pseudorhodoplanes sp.]
MPMTMRGLPALVAIGACVVIGASASSTSARAQDGTILSAPSEWSSQAQPQRRRPRVRVYPAPQPPFWEYPRPGTYSWPGPDAKRDCRAWYVLENRPSGPVLTPRMHCQWIPG